MVSNVLRACIYDPIMEVGRRGGIQQQLYGNQLGDCCRLAVVPAECQPHPWGALAASTKAARACRAGAGHAASRGLCIPGCKTFVRMFQATLHPTLHKGASAAGCENMQAW